MSLNKSSQNGDQAGAKSPSGPPRSLLANLLSSQRRSAAQSRRHLVQRAMPFANLHKEGSTGNAAVKSFKKGPSYSSSQAQKAPRSRLDGAGKTVNKSSLTTEGNTINQTIPKKIPNLDAKFNSTSQMVYSSSLVPAKAAIVPTAEEPPRKRVSFLSAGDNQPSAKVKCSPASTSSHAVVKQKSALKKRSREAMNSADIALPKREESEEDKINMGIELKAKPEKHRNEKIVGIDTMQSSSKQKRIPSEKVELKQEEPSKETNVNMQIELTTEERNNVDSVPASLKRKRVHPEKTDAIKLKRKDINKDKNVNMGLRPKSTEFTEGVNASTKIQPKAVECKNERNVNMGTELLMVDTSLKSKRIDADKKVEPMSLKVEQKAEAAANVIINTHDEETKIETPENPPKKKKKEFSPFRVKVGCVVAVRFRKLADGGNADIKPVKKVGDAYFPLPSSPDAADKTKSVGEPSKEGEDNQTPKDEDGIKPLTEAKTSAGSKDLEKAPPKPKTTKPRKPKLFEAWTSPMPGQDSGLSLLGRRIRCFFPKSLLAKWQKCSQNVAEGSLKRIVEGTVVSIIDTDSNFGVTVGLLVDRSALKLRPFLQTISDDVDDSKASASELKRRNLEATIRGKDKVVVKVTLSTIYESWSGSLDNGSLVKWVVATHVLDKPSGLKPSKTERKKGGFTSQSLFVGDGNDTPTQQEENWRWKAGKLAKLQSCDTILEGGNIIESQLIGEVVKMTVGTPTQGSPTSLATVTIRRLLAPHQTKAGRMPHHGQYELFDITSNDETGSEMSYIQAPVEHVIVIGRRVDRYPDTKEAQPASDLRFSITHSYNPKEDRYTPLSASKDPDRDHILDTSIANMCHSCRRLNPNMTRQICRKNDNCNNAWCLSCLQFIGVSVFTIEKAWIGPCCIGKCSCNVCLPLTNKHTDTARCFTCNRQGADECFVNCSSCNRHFHAECARWQRNDHVLDPEQFTCEGCSYNECTPNNLEDMEESFASKPVLSSLATLIKSSNPEDFMLPTDVGRLIIRPSFVPYSGVRKCKTNHQKKSQAASGTEKKKKPTNKSKHSLSNGKVGPAHGASNEFDVFKPSCSRTISFDEVKKMQCYQSHVQTALTETNELSGFRENARPRKVVIRKIEEKTNVTDRAARASQRRMLKSLSSFGDAAQAVDRLAGRDREEQLRFGRSLIHGWGVFATEPINAGDYIIEYRGELIGNAVADRRELEYERAKICDYMFRIDEHIVCDATKLGNVARYINASCSPNCYTQIITANENKRIVIYAKKDIQRGEELCYDYKFPHEYDVNKRIPCHCKSPNCRGFMNWDKRYILMDEQPKGTNSQP